MKYAIIDYRTSDEERKNLINLNCKPLICPPSTLLYDAICGHPDILLHIISKDTIIVHKDIDKTFVEDLQSLNLNIVFSKNSLQCKYPYDIILNSLNLCNYFIHNLKYTDSNLLNYVKDKKLINVKQGYTKCSTAIVKENAIITSDKTIAEAISKKDIDVLLLPPGDILLPGLNYGFIGGCCGLIDKDTLAFYGDLNHYAYGKEVMEFLEKHHVKPVSLRRGKLIDRGSIFIINI